MFDAALKIVYANKLVVELLVRAHLPSWAGRLDFSTLDLRSIEVVSDGLVTRRIDVLWSCETNDPEVEVLLVLEIQGEVEEHMASRIVVYGGLAGQRERKLRRAPGKPPPRFRVLKLVLHHGPGSWTASKRSWELFGDESPECYELVEPLPRGGPEPELGDLSRVIMGVVRPSPHAQAAAELVRLRRVVAIARRAVDPARAAELDRDVVGVAVQLLLLVGVPEEMIEEKGVHTVEAAYDVLQSSLRATALRDRRKGERKGRREGLREGRREGLDMGRRWLSRLAARKFDAGTARELATLLERIADPARLDEAAEAVMDCDESEELLRAARRLANGGNSTG